MRGLAQRTTDSTDEIKSNIEKLQQVTAGSVSMMSKFTQLVESTAERANSTEQSFRDVVNEIGTIRDMTTMIASATEQQLAVTEEIDRNISHISDMSRQSVTTVQGTSEDCQRMSQTSSQLIEAVQRFNTA